MTGIAEDQLRDFARRIESLEAEIADRNSDKSEVYKEARAGGFDVKILRKVIAYRRQREKHGEAALIEGEAIFDLYLASIEETTKPSRVHVHEEPPQESVSAPPQKAERRPSEPAGRSADASPATPSKPPKKDAGPIPAHLDRRPTSHVGHA